MTTKNVSFRVDHLIYECLQERCNQLGIPTVSDLLKSLVRYDLLVSKPHLATGDLFKMSADEQYRFDKRLAQAFNDGETTGGSWLEHAITKIVTQMGTPEEPDPTKVAGLVKNLLKP